MKTIIKLIVLTAVVIALCSLFFEYCINRPVSVYIQYPLLIAMIIIVLLYLAYLIKQISNFLNSK
ncbi:MAG: hypothetical protein K0S53_1561 [Bacteroidetes bacterium]|nr:hypothetical protein [Bacteroidota bacterium]